MQQALFVFKLEAFHMTSSLSAFQGCNKEGLVKSIWRNHSHEPKASILACIYFLFAKHAFKPLSDIYQSFNANGVLQSFWQTRLALSRLIKALFPINAYFFTT